MPCSAIAASRAAFSVAKRGGTAEGSSTARHATPSRCTYENAVLIMRPVIIIRCTYENAVPAVTSEELAQHLYVSTSRRCGRAPRRID
jgi:hypothetical protein